MDTTTRSNHQADSQTDSIDDLISRWDSTPENLKIYFDGGPRAGCWTAAGVLLIVTWTISIASHQAAQPGEPIGGNLSSFAFAGIISGLLAIMAVLSLKKIKLQKVANVLKSQILQAANVQLLSPLLDMTQHVVESESRVKQALISVLPTVTPENRPELTRSARTALHRCLLTKVDDFVDGTFMLALLPSLQYLGDAECLATVEKISRGKYCGSQTLFKKKADECLPAIRVFVSESNAVATHLRASSMPSNSAESLLRSSHSAGGDDSDQLLRAEVGPGE